MADEDKRPSSGRKNLPPPVQVGETTPERNQSPAGATPGVSTGSPSRRVSVSGVYDGSPTSTPVTEGRISAFMSWRKAHAGGHTMGGSMKSTSLGSREKKSVLIRRGSLRNMKQEDTDQIASLGIEDETLTQHVGTLYSPAMKHKGSEFVNDWLQAATIVTREQYKKRPKSDPDFDPTLPRNKTIEWWKDKRRTHCANMFYLALFGVASAIFADHTVHTHHGYTIRSLSLQFITFVSSGFAIHEIVWYYHTELCILRLKGWSLPPHFSPMSLRCANLFGQFVRDILFIIPQPLPFITTGFTFSVYDSGLDRYSEYPVDVLLLTFMFLRVLFLPRFFSHCVNDLRTDDADFIFSLSNTVLNDSFLLRFTMSTSLAAVAGIFALQIVLYGYTLLMFERSTQEGPLATWASAIWLIITTMTTVGYGDVYPTTRMGRVVAISASFSAMAMMAITISLVQSSLAMNRSESKVVWLHNGRSLVREKRNAAGKVVLATLRVNTVRKRCMRVIEEARRQEMMDDLESGVGDDTSRTHLMTSRTDESHAQGAENIRVSYRPPAPKSALHIAPGDPVMDKPLPNLPQGGGRGRAKVAEVYGDVLPDDVIVAEGQWHVAMRNFRSASRALRNDHDEAASDVTANISNVFARTIEVEREVEEIDDMLDEAERDLVLLLNSKRTRS